MDNNAFVPAPSTLYVVATPIGNLRDITLRALDVLRGVDAIAAEDTRVSKVLLAHYGIAPHLIALHAHNERSQSARVIALLAERRSVALITDAGTPAISDPGTTLVAMAREAGFAVQPIPGPSAVTAVLSVTGWSAAPFTFIGFLPSKASARRTVLDALRDHRAALVFFEAPHRIVSTVEALAAAFGSERRITIARELTKRFESLHETTLGGAVGWIGAAPENQRGEFVLVVEGAQAIADDAPGAADLRVFELLRTEVPASRAARLAADITGKSRDAFYRSTLEESPEG